MRAMTDEATTGDGDSGDHGQAGRMPLLRRGMLREAAVASDSYGLLLVLVLIDYVILSIGWTGDLANIVSTAFVCLTALLGFHTSHIRGRVLQVVRIACIVAMGSAIVSAFLPGSRSTGVAVLISGLLILSTPMAVLARIIHHEQVSAETLLGAICVYVLLGLVFSNLDYAVQLIGGANYSFFTQSGHHGPDDFAYFSFITMTTVGYGDLTPNVGFPRTMAVIEALTGQVFLVVMVSRLVAMYTPRPPRARLRSLARAGDAEVAEQVEAAAGPEPLDGPGHVEPD
jgi:ABC-type phosphate/phosphonate transport system permease subunit